jgi:hypothetical protein
VVGKILGKKQSFRLHSQGASSPLSGFPAAERRGRGGEFAQRAVVSVGFSFQRGESGALMFTLWYIFCLLGLVVISPLRANAFLPPRQRRNRPEFTPGNSYPRTHTPRAVPSQNQRLLPIYTIRHPPSTTTLDSGNPIVGWKSHVLWAPRQSLYSPKTVVAVVERWRSGGTG